MRSVKCKLQFILVMLLTITSLSVMADTYYHPGTSFASMKINGKLYTTTVSHSKINRKTKWWEGRGKPPIDKMKAYNLARAKLKDLFPSIEWKERETTLKYTTAKKGFYLVYFVDAENKNLGVGLFVLMTGKVSKIQESEKSKNKNYKVTNKYTGTSYSSSKIAAEIAYKKALDEATRMCRNKGGVLNIKQGSLKMNLLKHNTGRYNAKISLKYICRN